MSEGESTLDILLDAYREGCENYARDLENFTESLYAFCDELVRPALPDDWRQRLDIFLAEQEPKGYRVLPEHLPPLLEWIPTLEQYCHRQRADRHRAFMASETAQSGPTITIELPPGYPTQEDLAAARERDARIRAERHAMYEERNRQVLESERADVVTPANSSPSSRPSITLVGYPLRRRQGSPPKPRTRRAPGSPTTITPKAHLPADDRGTWIKGIKGDGVFRFNNSPKKPANWYCRQGDTFQGSANRHRRLSTRGVLRRKRGEGERRHRNSHGRRC